jgi:DNA-binding MarR family transcriptional regulator
LVKDVNRSRQGFQAAAQLWITLRRFRSRSEQITRAHGLTPERYQLLLLIKVSADDTATVGLVSKTFAIGQSAATQLVRRAEDLNLIERTLSRRDARVHPLRLTTEGERRLDAAHAELGPERTALLTALHELEPVQPRPRESR